MLRKHPSKPNSFLLDKETGKALFGVPGVTFEGPHLLAHRNHLTLVEDPSAALYLSTPSQSSHIWTERDDWCEGRGFKLRVTQQQAVDFARPRRGILLCDDMRLGKTVSALLCHREWQALYDEGALRANPFRRAYGPLIIVAPLSTRAVWLGWIRRLWPEAKIGIITGKKFKPEVLTQNDIVFGHYDVISRWQTLLDIGTLVLDEVHALSNPRADRTNAAVLLASRAKHVIAMTGTPIYTLPPNLWSILNLVVPGAWGSYFDFAQRYGAPEPGSHGWRYTGLSNEMELKARLSDVMLRRRWRDCHSDLPPITRSVVVADLNQTERNRLDVLAAKLKERSNTAGHLASYRQQVSAIKLKTVAREAERILANGQPVVIWTWHREYADQIAEAIMDGHGRPALVIHGDIVAHERDRRMQVWREMKEPGALIATMAVAGAGIDLSHARITIFAEIDYTPLMLGQAEMRTFAPDRPMDVIFVVANHFVDQRIVRALVSKLSASDPLGVGAAVDAIDALREAVLGKEEEGDLDRLLEAFLLGGD